MMHDTRYVLLSICFGGVLTLVQGLEEDKTEAGLSWALVSLVAVVGLLVAVLLCAGDSKSVQVKHSDAGSSKQNNVQTNSPRKTKPVFQEVEISKTPKTSVNLQNNPSQQRYNNVPRSEQNQQQNSANLETVVHLDNNSHAGPSTSNRIQHVEKQPSEDSLLVSNRTQDNSAPGPVGPIQRQNISVDLGPNNPGPRGPNNRNDVVAARRENTDDIGYHSDYSSRFKPDSDSNRLSTDRTERSSQPARSSHPPSQPRASTTNSDFEDDAIETYQDDGESIDWN